MYTIGISFGYHDSSIAVLEGNQIKGVFCEERFSRKKHDKDFPIQAWEYAKDKYHLDNNNIEEIVYYEYTGAKIKRIKEQFETTLEFVQYLAKKSSRAKLIAPTDEIAMITKIMRSKIKNTDHHLSHFAASLCMREIDFCGKVVGITIDGVGENTTCATFKAYMSNNKCTDVIKQEIMRYPASIGLFYSAITSFLGFEVNDAEYKVMGLAAYGESLYKKEIESMLNIDEYGRIGDCTRYFDYSPKSIYPYKGRIIKKLGIPSENSREYAEKFTSKENICADEKLQRYANIASSAQEVISEIVDKIFKSYAKVEKEIYYGGGVALNTRTNMTIMRKYQLNISPDPSDGGSALGAAIVSYINRKKDIPIFENAYLGYNINDDEIQKLVEMHTDIKYTVLEEKTMLKKAAYDLAIGKIIGWCQGRAEFGPRALGNRSILANPKDKEVQLKVNTAVKFREPFRPFAPAILEREAHKYFEIDRFETHKNSPYYYMLSVCKARELAKEKIPACIHIDGTSRVQIVNSEKNRIFNELIEEFATITGIPSLLNTSFNLRGEPIVNKTEDALKTFKKSNIDTLYIRNIRIEKKNENYT